MQFNPIGEGFTHSGRLELQAGGNLFTKFATTQSTNWNLQVNFNNAIQYALGNGAPSSEETTQPSSEETTTESE